MHPHRERSKWLKIEKKECTKGRNKGNNQGSIKYYHRNSVSEVNSGNKLKHENMKGMLKGLFNTRNMNSKGWHFNFTDKRNVAKLVSAPSFLPKQLICQLERMKSIPGQRVEFKLGSGLMLA